MKSFFKNKENVLLILIFLLGTLIRIIGVDIFPVGFYTDEASIGYEAYSLLNWGIDRHGITNPVHLIAWGSGQNVAYAWLCIPFITLFGLSEFTTRIPMAIIGSVSIIIFYLFVKEMYGNKKLALLSAFFFAICPWHIMKSRWGLESNLFPDLILWGSYLTLLSLRTKKESLLYIAFFIFGFSAYSYGPAYCFLPFFIIPLLIYMYCKKHISLKQTLVSFSVLGITVLPIVVFVLINTFDLPQINLGWMSIPRLFENRTEDSSIFSGNLIKDSLTNLKTSLEILILQWDKYPWNSIFFYGLTYIPTLPFAVYGIYKTIKESNKKYQFILTFWSISALVIISVISLSVNRINIIIIPLIFYTAIGLYYFIIKSKWHKNITLFLLGILFIGFSHNYFTDYQDNLAKYFFDGLGECIEIATKEEPETIYITEKVNAPYIFALFYSGDNVNDYLKTATFSKENVAMEQVYSYNNFIFEIPKTINKTEDVIYIVEISDLKEKDFNNFDITTIGQFALVKP